MFIGGKIDGAELGGYVVAQLVRTYLAWAMYSEQWWGRVR